MLCVELPIHIAFLIPLSWNRCLVALMLHKLRDLWCLEPYVVKSRLDLFGPRQLKGCLRLVLTGSNRRKGSCQPSNHTWLEFKRGLKDRIVLSSLPISLYEKMRLPSASSGRENFSGGVESTGTYLHL